MSEHVHAVRPRRAFAALIAAIAIVIAIVAGASPAHAATAATPKATSKTMMWSSSTSASYGTSVTMLVSVTAARGTPRGVVVIYAGSTPILDLTLSADGTTSFQAPSLSLRTTSYRAEYRGDARTASSVGPSLSLTGTKAPVTVTTTTSAAALSVGAMATSTSIVCATASGAGAPTGSLSVVVGTATYRATSIKVDGACRTYRVSHPLATLGAQSTGASFAGSGYFLSAKAAGPRLNVTASPAKASTALSTSQIVRGRTAKLTVTVSATTATATGTVTLRVNGTLSSVKATLVGGKATLIVPTSKSGTYSVQAVFSPTTKNVAATTSAARKLVVTSR